MPVALAVDKVGTLYVLDYNGSRVQKFDAQGNFIQQFGKPLKNNNTIASKSDLTLDNKGNVHVVSNSPYINY
ncbi:hypothetical protein [uncultured Pontibacter sp.]|uniref:hypothetical protein n=1 Tax=uncultured Pontibacter sp. TaxID=453356 RepID=UPI00344F40DE